MDKNFTFGSYIHKKRREIRRNLRETANLIGITPVYLGEMENVCFIYTVYHVY